MERKNKIREGKKRERKKHTEGRKKEWVLNFCLSVGDTREILKLIFNKINCLMKHSNLLC